MQAYKENSWNKSIQENAIFLFEKCVLVSMKEVSILRDVSFWLDGIAILVVASFGILLNLPVIFLFVTRRNLKNLFNVLFISLLCLDTCVLIVEVMTSLHDHHGFLQTSPSSIFPNLILPSLSRFSVTAIILIHIAISVERYLGTLYPLRHRSRISKKRLVKIYLPVITASVVCTIPVFFETPIIKPTSPDINHRAATTQFKHHVYYNIFYLGIVRAFFLGLLPFVILMLLNWKIFRAIIHSRNQSGRMRRSNRTPGRMRHPTRTAMRRLPITWRASEQNYKMAKALFFTAASFILCHLPRVIVLFCVQSASSEIEECAETPLGIIYPFPFWLYVLKYVSNVLVIINSSINPIIYCQFNKQIRKDVLHLARTVLCWSRCNQQITHNGNEEDEMQGAMLKLTTAHTANAHKHNSLKLRRVHLLSEEKRSKSI